MHSDGGVQPQLGATASDDANANKPKPWEYQLRKYLLLLATLVATVTYSAGFSPPGGVWQDTDTIAGTLAGEPIFRDTNYPRYVVFYYCNATAFASSLVVIVLILLLSIQYDDVDKTSSSTVRPPEIETADPPKSKFTFDNMKEMAPVQGLRLVMALDLLSLMGAYAAGTCRETLITVYSSVLVAVFFCYIVAQRVWLLPPPSSSDPHDPDHDLKKKNDEKKNDERLSKVLVLLATFAVSITYAGGLNMPGGFWNATEAGHHAGHAVLQDQQHARRLRAFLICNTSAFLGSLLIIMMLLTTRTVRKRETWRTHLYLCTIFILVSLVVAYTAGSCRQIDTTVYVGAGLLLAVLVCIALQFTVAQHAMESMDNGFGKQLKSLHGKLPKWLRRNSSHGDKSVKAEAMEKARSLVLLLATLAATITYQGGLHPPGGLWEDNGIGYKAGDPILLTTNPRRYKAFIYCNSMAFVTSLVAIILAQQNFLHEHHVLEAMMVFDLFGLIGAYAAGSCREVNSSIYAMALAGAVLVYVVIHIVFFTMDHKSDSSDKEKEDKENESVEKRRKRLLLFAILAATITYQAGLTPPGGFLLTGDKLGHNAGDPVLLYNYPRRYKAFFYSNSVIFMLSIALIILLVNPHLYRPAIRSLALAVCTAAGLFGLLSAFAAGSTQHLKTSIYIFALVAVVLFFVTVLLFIFLWIQLHDKNNTMSSQHPDHANSTAQNQNSSSSRTGTGSGTSTTNNGNGNNTTTPTSTADSSTAGRDKIHEMRKYLMLLGILVGSVTYQAGLDPPGGVWQGNDGGHAAGDPVMHDNRRQRYLAFFYSNSTSFMASIVVIVLLMIELRLPKSKPWLLRVMNTTIVLDLLFLLAAYAAGSCREWKTSVYVAALTFAVLAYVAIHVLLSLFSNKIRKEQP